MFNLLFIFKVEKKILLEEEGNIKEKIRILIGGDKIIYIVKYNIKL